MNDVLRAAGLISDEKGGVARTTPTGVTLMAISAPSHILLDAAVNGFIERTRRIKRQIDPDAYGDLYSDYIGGW